MVVLVFVEHVSSLISDLPSEEVPSEEINDLTKEEIDLHSGTGHNIIYPIPALEVPPVGPSMTSSVVSDHNFELHAVARPDSQLSNPSSHSGLASAAVSDMSGDEEEQDEDDEDTDSDSDDSDSDDSDDSESSDDSSDTCSSSEEEEPEETQSKKIEKIESTQDGIFIDHF